MSDSLLEIVRASLSSPWLYAAILALALADALLPVAPSETAVIAAGVLAATGQPNLLLLVAAAAAGAFVGDHGSYVIGRRAGPRLLRSARRASRRWRAYRWASGALHRRGASVLVVARYVPGGRTTVTLTAGAVGCPLRSFAPYVALAAVSWATYYALVGYVGGLAFETRPVLGVLLGIGFAVRCWRVRAGRGPGRRDAGLRRYPQSWINLGTRYMDVIPQLWVSLWTTSGSPDGSAYRVA